MSSLTIHEALQQAQAQLMQADVPDAALDAQWLLCHLLHTDRMQMLMNSRNVLDEDMLRAYRSLLCERCKRIPLQYLLGTQSFFGLHLQVDSRVLIPRPETEQLCEAALGLLQTQGSRAPRLLDLCTGSGAIAIAMKKHCPAASITACDISADALAVARQNDAAHQTGIAFYQGDLFSALPDDIAPFDMILSNPPYICTADCEALQPEVRHEPLLALAGGSDGLAFYRRITADAARYLKPQGVLIMELGCSEAPPVREMMQQSGFVQVTVLADYEGIDRIIYGYYRASL